MNPGTLHIVAFGSIAVMVAVLMLSAMVHFELGHNARLLAYRRWILAAALGSGVLAFAFKLAIIVNVEKSQQVMSAKH